MLVRFDVLECSVRLTDAAVAVALDAEAGEEGELWDGGFAEFVVSREGEGVDGHGDGGQGELFPPCNARCGMISRIRGLGHCSH
jgi:hypothetical protein